jgi:hypothetical protein
MDPNLGSINRLLLPDLIAETNLLTVSKLFVDADRQVFKHMSTLHRSYALSRRLCNANRKPKVRDPTRRCSYARK